MPYHPPIVSYIVLYSHAPSKWHRADSWSLLLPKTHNLPVAGEQERDRQIAGHVQKKSKQHQ